MNCRLCNSHQIEVAFDFGPQPIVHHMTTERCEPTRYPMQVGYCVECGFMQMLTFPPLDTMYRDYLTPSAWKPQPHADRILTTAKMLFGIDLDDKIFEIGCNDGSFLDLLATRGYHNCAGIEPTLDCSTAAVGRGFHVIPGYFSAGLDLFGADKPKLIVSRQVLEHIPDIMGFLAGAKETLAHNGGLVIEVPDHAMNYENLDYAFWEEHVNYFTINTLRLALEKSGFEIIHHETALFSGRALMVYAQHSRHPRSGVVRNRDAAAVLDYRIAYPTFRKALRAWMVQERAVVLYGAGCRSVNFTNLMGMQDMVYAVVDDQPEKQGLWVPGINVKVQSFSQQVEGGSILLGVNAESETAVIAKKNLKRYASILPPSRHLPEFWRALSAGRGARISEAAE